MEKTVAISAHLSYAFASVYAANNFFHTLRKEIVPFVNLRL